MKAYTIYYLAWSPKGGESTYTRTFYSKDERDRFRARIASAANSVSSWENTYTN